MIFVTGGTGFLGRHLVPLLVRAGYRLRLLTRDPAAHPWLVHCPGVEVVAGDLRDPEAITAPTLSGCDSVIHAGGLFSFWGSPAAFAETNVRGTQNLLNAVAAHGGIRRFVHVSTIAVIGHPHPTDVMDETYPPTPADAYQESKLRAERLVLHVGAQTGLPVVVVRPGAFYGPMGSYAFNRLFFTDPMRGIIMQVNGGRYVIFPAYVGDVAEGLRLALKSGTPGEVYNICGEPITHRDAFAIVRREAGLWWPPLPVPGWLGLNVSRVMTAVSGWLGREPFWPITLRSYVYNSWRVSNAKARRELGFVPTDFLDGARATVAWYKAGRPNHLAALDCTTPDDPPPV